MSLNLIYLVERGHRVTEGLEDLCNRVGARNRARLRLGLRLVSKASRTGLVLTSSAPISIEEREEPWLGLGVGLRLGVGSGLGSELRSGLGAGLGLSLG